MLKLTHIFNQIERMEYWAACNKYPRISGAYTKPEGFPEGGRFHPTYRESKCWCSAKLYNHALSKKKRTAAPTSVGNMAIVNEIIAPPFRMVWK